MSTTLRQTSARTRTKKGTAKPMPETAPTDVQLVEQFEAGDRHAFDDLIHRYYGRAMKLAYGFVGNRELAQDIVQEAFAKAYRALDSYDHSKAFSTWFFRICTNLCIDKLRRKRHQVRVSLDMARDYNLEPASPERFDKTNEVKEAVNGVIRTLPKKYTTVLTMRDLNDFSCEQIAEILHISASTVRWRLAVARKMFKEKWEKKYRD